MWLKDFVKTTEFEELFQKHILDNGGDIGEYRGKDFVIVSDWDNVHDLELVVNLMVEDLEIDFDDIMDAYIGTGNNSVLWGFNDEYMRVSCCDKIVRTSPTHYGWTPDYVYGEEEIMCKTCLLESPNWYVEELTNNPKLVNSVLPVSILVAEGFKLLDTEVYQTGFHTGMNDNPKAVFDLLHSRGYDVIFHLSDKSQFYVEWQAYVKPIIYECRECGKEFDASGVDLKLGTCYECISAQYDEE